MLTKSAGLVKAFLWLILTFVFAYLFGGSIPYFIFYTSLALVIIGLIWARIITRVAVVCYMEAASAQVGKKVKVVIEVENLTGWPVPWVQYWVQMPGSFYLPDNLACYTFSLRPHEKKVFSETLRCRLRGNFPWGMGLLKTGDVFGLFDNSISVGESRELVVLPEVIDMGIALENVWGRRSGEISRSRRAGRSGSCFLGVRSYGSTDGISKIHWKASARSGKLLVKDFQEHKLLDFMIFLDLHADNHAGDGPEGSIEKAVSLAASIAASAIRAGCGIGLRVFGQDYLSIPVGYGRSHFGAILQALVGVRPGTGFNFGERLGYEISLMDRNCYAEVITGALDNDLVGSLLRLKSRGPYAAVFLLEQESFGAKGIDPGQGSNCLAQLNAVGIPLVGIKKDSDLRLVFGGLENDAG